MGTRARVSARYNVYTVVMSRIPDGPHVTDTERRACQGFREMGAEKARRTAGWAVRLLPAWMTGAVMSAASPVVATVGCGRHRGRAAVACGSDIIRAEGDDKVRRTSGGPRPLAPSSSETCCASPKSASPSTRRRWRQAISARRREGCFRALPLLFVRTAGVGVAQYLGLRAASRDWRWPGGARRLDGRDAHCHRRRLSPRQAAYRRERRGAVTPFRLWVYLQATPLFWLTATLAAFLVADALAKAGTPPTRSSITS